MWPTGEGMEAGGGGEVARHMTATVKEAERDGWASACSLLFIQSGTTVCSGRVFPVQLNLSGNSLLDISRGISRVTLNLVRLTGIKYHVTSILKQGWVAGGSQSPEVKGSKAT